MNRKGDLPTAMIFIVALVLVVSALFIFITFDNKLEKNSNLYSEMAFQVDFSERYIKESAKIIGENVLECEKLNNGEKEKRGYCDGELKGRYKIAAKKQDLGINEMRSFYGKVERGDFSFEMKDNKYLFEMKDVETEAVRGDNRIRRKFNFGFEIGA